METLDHDYTMHTAAQSDADKALAVRFFSMPIQNDVKTVEEGRPIFDDTDMVEIRIRGDRNNITCRPVRDQDKSRFREAYRAYKDGAKASETGTPLSEWPIASASMVEELKYLGFHTVEHVANASEAALARVPGLHTLKQRAAAFIEFAKGGAPMERMQSELDKERSAREASEAQLADLSRRMAEMEAKQATEVKAAKPVAK